jgi:hypothetical protein
MTGGRLYRIAGCDVVVSADDSILAARLDEWLVHFAPGPPGPPRARVELDWRVAEGAATASPPAGARLLVDYYYVSGWRDGERTLFAGTDGSRLELEADAPRGTGVVPAAALAGPPWALRDLASAALTALLRRQGRFPIHAAAVASPDGAAGLLVVGPPMAGKTSLALNFARRGFRWVSDDKLLVCDAGDGRVRVEGLFRPSNVDPWLGRWFPEFAGLDDREPAHPHSAKRIVDVERYYGRVAVPDVVPTHLLFPAVVDTGPTIVRPLDADAAFRVLLEQSPIVNEPREARIQLDLLGRLARGVRAFRLLQGRDLLEEPGRLRELARTMGFDLPMPPERRPPVPGATDPPPGPRS